MSAMIMVPFSHLVLLHREIGIHRGRKWGFRDVFGFHTLSDEPFVTLASKVKDAYEGRDVPSHDGWPAQHEALRWLVEKGHDGIYALDEQGLKLISSSAVLEARKIKLEAREVRKISRAARRLNAHDPLSAEEEIKLADGVSAAHDEGYSALALDAQENKLMHNLRDALEEQGLQLASNREHFYVADGHHRALALYILGHAEVRARVLSKDEAQARISKDDEPSRGKS